MTELDGREVLHTTIRFNTGRALGIEIMTPVTPHDFAAALHALARELENSPQHG